MEEHDSCGVPCQVEGSGSKVSMVTFDVCVADRSERFCQGKGSPPQFFRGICAVVFRDSLLQYPQPVLRARPPSAENSVWRTYLLFFALHYVLVWEFNSFSFQHLIITPEKFFSCPPSLKLLKCVLVPEMYCCFEVGYLKIVKAIFPHYGKELVRSPGWPMFDEKCLRLCCWGR